MTIHKLIDLDNLQKSEIDNLISFARDIESNRVNVTRSMKGKVLCPVFGQESSRTYMNSVSSFLRMGGSVLPITLSGTRFGSKWKEPIQDFATLLNSCTDFVICRDSKMQTVRDLATLINIPFINAGNGVGIGAEHPMQALVDLYTIRGKFKSKKLNILMMGGTHIRTTRTQIKLFKRYGHNISIISPPTKVDNSDIDTFIAENCSVPFASEYDQLQNYDVIYHNGIDENPDTLSPEGYLLTFDYLKDCNFKGVIMHSLPRKNELSSCIDNTPFNLYFRQMEVSKWIFQSIYYHQNVLQKGIKNAA